MNKEDLKDPRKRLNNLYKIVTKKGELVPFKENPIQAQLNSLPHKRKIILKARQFGISTNELLKALDFACFNRNKTVCILSHDQDSLEKLFKIVKKGYESLPPRFAPKLDRGGGSKYELRFPEINSTIYTDLESRGDTIQWLHVSEAAFADQDRIRATLEAVPLETGIATLESTPNGIGGYFYEQWQNGNFHKLFLPWFFHDEYAIHDTNLGSITEDEEKFIKNTKSEFGIDISLAQIAYRRFKQKDLTSLYEQEYPENDRECFLASGNAAMDLKLVSALLKEVEPLKGKDEIFRVYKTKVNGHKYVIGADVAEGVRKDYSTATVIDTTTKETVAQFRSNKIKPGAFAKELMDIAKSYHYPKHEMPLIGCEVNNHGHTTNYELDRLGYPNIFRHNGEDCGWKTNTVTRPLMIDAFIDAVEDRTIKIHDYWTLSECLTLIDNDGKIEANDGYNDDCVVSCAIAVQMLIADGVSDVGNLYQRILV